MALASTKIVGKHHHPTINTPEKVTVLVVAILLDAISFIPIANFVSTALGTITLGGWSWLRMGRKTRMQKIKRSGTLTVVATIVEAIPGASMIPSWTLFVVIRLWLLK